VLSACGHVGSSTGDKAGAAAAPPRTLAHIGVVGTNVAWAEIDSRLLRTLDGGSHWLEAAGPAAAGERVDSTEFLSDRQAVVALTRPGFPVAIAGTVDGGVSWTRASVPLSDGGSSGRTSLTFLSTAVGWLSIEHQHNSGVIGSSEIFKTTDGARSWKTIGSQALPSSPVGPIRFTSELDGWGLSAARNRLYRTADGGRTWSEVSVSVPGGLATPTASLTPTISLPSFFGRKGVLPVFYDSSSTRTAVFYTTTDGQSWVPARPLSDSEFAEYGQGIALPTSVTSPTAWAVASGPAVYVSVDGGQTWRHASAPDAIGARDLAMPSPNQIWIAYTNIRCVSKGVGCVTATGVVRSDNGGTTWSHIEP